MALSRKIYDTHRCSYARKNARGIAPAGTQKYKAYQVPKWVPSWGPIRGGPELGAGWVQGWGNLRGERVQLDMREEADARADMVCCT